MKSYRERFRLLTLNCLGLLFKIKLKSWIKKIFNRLIPIKSKLKLFKNLQRKELNKRAQLRESIKNRFNQIKIKYNKSNKNNSNNNSNNKWLKSLKL